MKKIVTAGLVALTLTGGAVAAATPAAAQGWHGGGYRGGGWHGGYRGWGPGAAVGAGILGLAVGATLAADRPYYGGYYAPRPYYGYGYGYYGCRSHARWNPYWGGYERVRVCY